MGWANTVAIGRGNVTVTVTVTAVVRATGRAIQRIERTLGKRGSLRFTDVHAKVPVPFSAMANHGPTALRDVVVDALIFDLDGTILDTTEELCHAVSTAVNRMNASSEGKEGRSRRTTLTASEIVDRYPHLIGAPLEEFHDVLVMAPPNSSSLASPNDEVTRHAHASSTRAFIRHFLRAIDAREADVGGPVPFPDVPPVLRRLRDAFGPHTHTRFGVATTKPTDVAVQALQPLLSSLGVGVGVGVDFFHHVQGTDPGIRPKPHPDVIVTCASALGISLREVPAPPCVVYIGDTQRDVEAAHAAGCGAILIRRDGGRNPETFGADALIHSFDELEDAVARTVVSLRRRTTNDHDSEGTSRESTCA